MNRKKERPGTVGMAGSVAFRHKARRACGAGHLAQLVQVGAQSVAYGDADAPILKGFPAQRRQGELVRAGKQHAFHTGGTYDRGTNAF